MEATGLRALTAIASSSLMFFHSHSRASLLCRPFLSLHCRSNSFHFPYSLSSSRFSSLCSLSKRWRADSLPNGFGGAAGEVPSSKEFLHVVLVSPQVIYAAFIFAFVLVIV